MLQALNKRGFKKGSDSRNHIQTRFGWNFDAIPALVKDIEEFQPDVVFIDSLTYANRYSVYDENRTEYARPVLELTSIAEEHGTTIIIIHHSSRGSGKPRGTTAIFNAVSEVYKLEKDTSNGAATQEKVLTIEKSRSRRFPCKYKLAFEEEDFSLVLLEEVGEELNSSDASTKDRIVEFLLQNKNTKFESEEIAHSTNFSLSHTRRCCAKLHRDGLINCDETSKSGTKKLYYISFEDRNCSIYNTSRSETVTSTKCIDLGNRHDVDLDDDKADVSQSINKGEPTPDHLMITLGDQLCTQDQESDSSKGDHSVHENSEKNFQKKSAKNEGHMITFPGKKDGVSDSGGDQGSRSSELECDQPVENFLGLNNSNVVPRSELDPSFKKNKRCFLKIQGIIGIWKVRYKIGSQHIHLKYKSPDGKEGESTEFVEITPRLNYEYFRELVERSIWRLESGLLGGRTFRIQMWLREGVDELEPRWLHGCKLISTPDAGSIVFVFETPDGETFPKFGLEEFEIMDWGES